MIIDFKSADITVDKIDSSPFTEITLNGKSAVLHLSRNSDPIIAQSKSTSDADASAINISGQVDLQLQGREQISRWSFHFIQFARLNVAQVIYAGRSSWHGSMALNYALPPAFPAKFAYQFVLDSDPKVFGPGVLPFTNLRAPNVFQKLVPGHKHVPGALTISTDMDDHPNARMTLKLRNNRTGMDNFLFRATRDVSFLTAFVVRDEQTKVITPLAHVTWQIVWRAQYDWENERCTGRMTAKTFDVDKVIQGPPADAALAAQITKPTTDASETANALGRAAIQALNNHPAVSNVAEGNRWPGDVPKDFFK
jgi:hypothetical protein